ncbi:hypothetical protein, partial [Paraclostridium dentum]|uniref:hypothetical protein n=1 Tax=Paraclostridium dentum TaxID=2662455 RepID=UPI003F66E454
ISTKASKATNQVSFCFIRRKGPHYIQQAELLTKDSDGGQQAIDCEWVPGTLSIICLKLFIKGSSSIWFHTPTVYFKHLGPLIFF